MLLIRQKRKAPRKTARCNVLGQDFLSPFVRKPTPNTWRWYVVVLRGRRHETLVNSFTDYLTSKGLSAGRNQAIDIGLENPSVIVEAKLIRSWAGAIREAVGQLYEYRYFQVASPTSRLIFLASAPVPDKWIRYLEDDRGIAVAWNSPNGFVLTKRAREALGLI